MCFLKDCAPGYTRTGTGLYLGHCELCECNGHSDSCHPETGICTVWSTGPECDGRRPTPLLMQCASSFRAAPITLRASSASFAPPASSAIQLLVLRLTASCVLALTLTQSISKPLHTY